jgi:hypothetical protein
MRIVFGRNVWDVEQDSIMEAVLDHGLKKLSLLGDLAMKVLSTK